MVMKRGYSKGTRPVDQLRTNHETGEHSDNCTAYFVVPMKYYNVGGSCMLKVPSGFVTQHFSSYGKKIEMLLENEEAKQWPVTLVSNNLSGWSQFVRDNHIKVGDTCTFELKDKLKLLVHISRQSTQLKRPAANPDGPEVHCDGNGIVNPTSNGLINLDHVSDGAHNVAQVPTSNGPEVHCDGDGIINPTSNGLINLDHVSDGAHNVAQVSTQVHAEQMSEEQRVELMKTQLKRSAANPDGPEVHCDGDGDGIVNPTSNRLINLDHVSDGAHNVAQVPTQVHAQQMCEEQRVAQSNSDDNDFRSFTVIMKHYNITRCIVNVTSKIFSDNCSNYGSKETIVLQNEMGKEWSVTMSHDGNNHIRLSAGWSSFVRDNQIKVEDACTFKFVQERKMMVYISRHCPLSQMQQLEMVGNQEEPQPKVFRVKRKYRKSKLGYGIVKRTSTRLTKRDVEQHHISVSAKKLEVPSQLDGTNHWAEEQGVTKSDANDFRSFTVSMKKYNIHRPGIINISTKFVSTHWSNYEKKEKIVVENEEGNQWSVTMSRQGNGGQLTGGWHLFVCDNQIKEKDTCTFELVAPRKMLVHISRHCALSQMEASPKSATERVKKRKRSGVKDETIAKQLRAAVREIAEVRKENKKILEMLKEMKNFGARPSR